MGIIINAAYFSVLFNIVPAYKELRSGAQKIAQLPVVNKLFHIVYYDDSSMVNLVVGRWNTMIPTIIRMADDLEELGFQYSDDELNRIYP